MRLGPGGAASLPEERTSAPITFALGSPAGEPAFGVGGVVLQLSPSSLQPRLGSWLEPASVWSDFTS